MAAQRYKQIILTAFLILVALARAAPAFAETLSINTTSPPPLAKSDGNGYQDRIAHEVFRRLGFDITINILPGERSLRNLDQGIDDATLVRIRGMENTYPNVVLVPEKVMDWTFVAFISDPSLKVTKWEDLSGKSIAFMNGWKIFEANAKKASDVTTTSNPEILFGLLAKGRTKIVLFEQWSGLQLINDLRLDDVMMQEPPLAVREMFMYVHKRHAALVPALAEALAAMKHDGAYKKIYNETLGQLLAAKAN